MIIEITNFSFKPQTISVEPQETITIKPQFIYYLIIIQ